MATREEVLAVLRAHGKSVRQWAVDNDFSPANVRSVIYGKNPPKRGEKYRIAKVLGLIEIPTVPLPSVHDKPDESS